MDLFQPRLSRNVKPSRSTLCDARIATEDWLDAALVNGGPQRELLGQFESVSLADLSNAALQKRSDTKYLLGGEDLEELLPELSNQYRVLEVEQLRLSPYSTLYFDTPDLACYKAHHNGKLNRWKYRMRRYDANGSCFLEVKLKNSKGQTDKQRMAVAGVQEELDAHHASFLASVAPDVLKLGFDDLLPQLWTMFLRMTLVHRSLAERVTIDSCLSFHNGERQVSLPEVLIAEVKQPRDDRQSPIRKKLRQCGIRPQRVSKYCLGSVLLNPDLKHNRFKTKLRSLQRIAAS